MKKPTLFGKYLLLERINVGGMAEVFTAKAFGVEGFERILAIKKILPTMAEDEEFITMFIDEARISVQLNHANIVHIHELGKHEDTYFIAMEYVSGRDLRTLLERYRRRKEIMPTAQAVFVASKICEGLDYAHRKKDARGQDLNIIHRDISPQNILISYEGEVKLIDFGIAKAANRSQKTQAGILKGKFGYMSPEQVRGLPIDRRSDVFAVGVILYEMLTGERLFVGESDFSTLEKVRSADVPMPRQFNPNIPAGLEKVLMKALARDAEDRYQWGSDLQEDLMRFLLAGDAIYSSKHLSGFMKEAFAEDIVREAEKMERYASVERPEQIETSGVTGDISRAPRRQQAVPSTPVASRSPTSAQPAVSSGYIPPPTEDELAELDGAGDKTQIVDSSIALSGASSQGPSASVLVDDSLTGETSYPPETDETLPPTPRDRFRGGGKPQVVIGEGEGYSGATVIGPAPTARPSQEEPADANATRVGQIESGSTMLSPMPTGQRMRLQMDEEQDSSPPHEDEQDEQQLSEDESQDEYGDPGADQQEDPQEEETTGPVDVPSAAAQKPTPEKSKPTKAPRAVGAAKKLPPKAIIGIAAGAALLVIVVLAAVIFSGPRTGSLMISVQPAEGSEVRIDGKIVAQNQVIQLPEGAHKLTATAPGHLPAEQSVTVTKGQRPQVVSIALDAEPPPDKPAATDTHVASATGTGTGTATGTGTGTGDAPPNGTQPTETPPKQEPASQTASATGTGTGTGTDTPPAAVEPPKPTTFAAVFVGDSGAEVEVAGKRVGRTPDAKLANLTIGKSYSFTVSRAGYKSYSGKFRSDGETEVQVPFELEKEEPPPTPERQATKPPSTPKNSGSSKAPAPPPARAAKGKLACSSRPAGAQIWVDGKNTGRETPVALGNPLILPVGSRTVVFKLGGKQSKPQKVNITEGDVAKLINIPVE
ncbi:serine/threonine-protein kinase [Vitiosangium sp. GDMCC 1.1324]|uniref:serine/threonine protein kinase n=1 Tax=Vitiosangium sp. (strain GDMCC 1.1324) TaxID=2138576 RepID=UPI000D3CACF0|nr:serine/threonine-protein kinase [Vitiosangium sp. GDMCC 1.1324]PTL76080.1 protein kinase [Vitiosangium sp. GDMCC 1.1324]